MSKITLAVDSTQIELFRKCPQQWAWNFARNIVPRHDNREALDKGSIMHSLLEYYYSGRTPAESITLFNKQGKEYNLDPDTLKLLTERFLQYCGFWSNNDFKVIRNSTELGFTVPIVDNKYYLFALEGRIDALVKVGPTICLVDHKTMSRDKTYPRRRIQFFNYCIAGKIQHFCVNYIGLQQKVTDKTFRRDLYFYSDWELERWKEELKTTFYQMAECLSKEKFDRRLEHCAGDYGRECPYTDLCDAENRDLVERRIHQFYKIKPMWEPWALGESSE